jgi:hypothetical protein
LQCHQEQEQNGSQQSQKLPGTKHVSLEEFLHLDLPSTIVVLVGIFDCLIQEGHFGQSNGLAHTIEQICHFFITLQTVQDDTLLSKQLHVVLGVYDPVHQLRVAS